MMKAEKGYIEYLVDQFVSKKINRTELVELQQLINSSDNNDEVVAILYQFWNNTAPKNLTIDKKQAFNKLINTLEISQVSTTAKSDKSGKVAIKNTYISILKYAAVILVAVTVTLLGQMWSGRSLNSIGTVAYQEYHVPMGSKSNLTLEDGTKIWINSGSTLKYPVSFENGTRDVFLTGEAYFEVAKEKSRQFIVHTNDLDIKVLGTKFNVKSYSDDETVETMLVSGKIVIEKQESFKSKSPSLPLNMNERASYSKESGKITIYRPQQEEQKELNKTTIELEKKQVKVSPLPQEYIEQFIGWKENKLVFNSVPFKTLVVKLERWYGVIITIEKEELNKFTFTGSFSNETLEQALEALKLTTPFTYNIEKNKVVIK